jgi:hypothetical protein
MARKKVVHKHVVFGLKLKGLERLRGRILEAGEYEEVPGFCESATLNDVASQCLITRAVCKAGTQENV